jgi:hypothetical protein
MLRTVVAATLLAKNISAVPKSIARVFVLELENTLHVSAKSFMSSVPLVSVHVLLMVNALDKLYPLDELANRTGRGNVYPLVSIVETATPLLKVIFPVVPVIVKLVAGLTQLPRTVSVEVPKASVIAPSSPDMVQLLQVAAETVTVNAPVPTLELTSK